MSMTSEAGSVVHAESVLHTEQVIAELPDYLAVGGGEGLAAARHRGPEEVWSELIDAGLRGRGGAGFPTGVKWRTVRGEAAAADASAGPSTTYVVCNAAEGEPATFKDRWLLRRNPFQVLEGLLIAAETVGARRAFVALKERFEPARTAVEHALDQLATAGWLEGIDIEVVAGPDAYLYGEETAMLEVVEGREALPRVLPPYQVGLFAAPGSANPTAVNNAETLAHVPAILREGADWFRGRGTEDSPGTMLFTVCGDVRRAGVVELELGTTLGALIDGWAGGTPNDAAFKVAVPGASNAVLTREHLEVPLCFEAMSAAGSGLGSGGFAVYDTSACIVRVAAAFSRFLFAESCAQCPVCKEGCREITDRLERLDRGTAGGEAIDRIRKRAGNVTGGSRCGLPVGEQKLIGSILEHFGDEVADHAEATCRLTRRLPLPHLDDFDEDAARFVYRGASSHALAGASA